MMKVQLGRSSLLETRIEDWEKARFYLSGTLQTEVEVQFCILTLDWDPWI